MKLHIPWRANGVGHPRAPLGWDDLGAGMSLLDGFGVQHSKGHPRITHFCADIDSPCRYERIAS